jgi:uncharacterized protein YcfL
VAPKVGCQSVQKLLQVDAKLLLMKISVVARDLSNNNIDQSFLHTMTVTMHT